MTAFMTKDEIGKVQQSWQKITSKVGMETAGLAILEKLFMDVPDAKQYFQMFNISPENNNKISIEQLRKIKMVRGHALKITTTVSAVVQKLDDGDEVRKMCEGLGRAHKSKGVKPEYFDKMAPVLMAVITQTLQIDMKDSIAHAWVKLYGEIAKSAKSQMV